MILETNELVKKFGIPLHNVKKDQDNRKYVGRIKKLNAGNKGYSKKEMQEIFKGKKCTTKNF